ncbi:hypothetical protein [Bradyrhizobium sp. 174]|uniref:hypothetical protein n=1 Tax=Bradyrhizobium sp. 174 TaxID=2782645 RepID=UPI001FF755F7|nr:hypothetical protein [Bradyrhizobium sp. 174]
MTALVSYSTGSVSVAVGGTTVTGVGSIWSGTNARPGDVLQIGNFQTVISDVTDTTHLVIPPWGGGAQSGVAYQIWQVSPQRFAGAQAMQSVNDLVAALNTSGFFVFVDVSLTVPDPSLGDDGQYAFQPTTGKTWAKVAGVWTYLGIYKGFNFTGAYNGATTYSYGDVMTDSGSSYVWINATPGSGHAAPNTTCWQLLASIGNTGNTGPTGAGYGGTSTTSLAITVASKVFTTQAGLAYTNGARVRASSAANTSNWMEGLATYSGTTLTIAVDKINGSGTFADWNLNSVGQPGAGDLSSANNLSDLASAATAATNLGVVRYAAAQTLTAAQQAQARANINVTKKNYIINGGMQVSQENGATASAASGYFPVDQFSVNFTTGGSLSTAQVASPTPGGSPNRLRVTVTATDTSIAVGDLLCVETRLEGLRIADLRAGSASAKTITLQFGVKAPAGTYCLGFRNGTPDRSYVAEFTITGGEANTDVVKSVTFQLDTSGTWLTTNGLGMVIDWTLMAGTSYQMTPNTWAGASSGISSPSQFNFMGTNGNVFELFDVGLYEGAAAPSFQLPDFVSELALCQRYWEKTYDYATAVGSVSFAGMYQVGLTLTSATFDNASGHVIMVPYRPKRASPTVTIYSPNTGASGKNADFSGSADMTASVANFGMNCARISANAFGVSRVISLAVHATMNARM